MNPHPATTDSFPDHGAHSGAHHSASAIRGHRLPLLLLLLLLPPLLLHLHVQGLAGPSATESTAFAAEPEPESGSGSVMSIAILPDRAVLTGPDASQRLIVMRTRQSDYFGEARGAALMSSDPSVVAVEADGTAVAKSNGRATITATADGASASATVIVRGFERKQPWSFSNHVLPILSRAGCNMGACHGALAGKGGFRLSLRGYDPASDHERITREARGRRVELSDPARSLFLTKPTAAVRHKGGKRIDPRTRDYRILSEWIANGAAAPGEDEPVLERVEVLPSRSILAPGARQRLIVRAIYSDGREEDVTQWARLTSTDQTVARVDAETGEAEVIGHGEAGVAVWFSSRIVLARLTVPFPHRLSETDFAGQARRGEIDTLVLDQLRRLNLKPSPRSTDSEFLRRVYLDTIGVLPTPDETRAFLESDRPDKRDRVIDRLLAREEFVDYWTYRWADLFLINGRLLRPAAVEAYYGWLREQVRRNTPWDELVRQVVTAKGGTVESGASNFYAVHQEPETMAENVSQAFMSLSINCAKCHNHPLEKWTNDQYYSFANLFSRVRAKGWGGDARNGDGIRTLYVARRGDLIQPRTGRPQPPAPLDGEPVPADDTADRREHLADWLTSPDNSYFTRSIANRVWAAFFGRGIVEPVDDLRASNPASNEALLDAIAGILTESGYDLKALMRAILTSETYQRSSRPLPENRDENQFFSRIYPRRLMAEVLHDAIAFVTDVPSDFDRIALTDGSTEATRFYPKGTRALELFDSSVASYFLKTFGRNERAITCECERSNQPSLVQVLHLSNGDTLNEKLRHPNGRVAALLNQSENDSDLVRDAYLLCLSRFPTPDEQTGMEALLASSDPAARQDAVEDLFWALLTSREFLFQH